MQIDVRFTDGSPSEALQTWARRRVLFALGQFGPRVRAVCVRLGDLNGPKGGNDQRCLIEATLERGPGVVAVMTHPDPYAAISRACDRLRRRVTAEIERSRMGRRGGRSGLLPQRRQGVVR